MAKSPAVALALLLASAALLFGPVLARLAGDWAHDDNYSHGFLVVPIAAYFAWERRAKLSAASRQPSFAGLIVVLAGLALLVAGILGAEFFLTRVSIIVVLAGAILFLFGREHLRILAFPLAFLLLMIPIPAIIFNQIAFPLQLLRLAVRSSDDADVPPFPCCAKATSSSWRTRRSKWPRRAAASGR